MKFAVEKFIDIVNELKPLFEEHYIEIARHKDKIKLKPDYEKYFEMENIGSFHVITAREENELAGYCFNFILPNPHFTDCLIAVNDVIFIRKFFRKGNNGAKFIEYVECILKDIGIMKFIISTKLEHNFGNLLKRMNYTPIEMVYEKMFFENMEDN